MWQQYKGQMAELDYFQGWYWRMGEKTSQKFETKQEAIIALQAGNLEFRR